MTSKKRKYGNLSERATPTDDDALLDDVFAAFTGKRAEASASQPEPTEIAQSPVIDEPQGIPSSIPTGIPSAIPESISTKAPKRTQKVSEDPETSEQTTPLDATHTGSEKSVYSIMYRETISKGASERHFGPAELMKKTGIRSRNTVHKALYGLIEKLSIEVIAETRGNPLGPRYRVYKPQTIEQHRRTAGIKIDPQTKKITVRGGIPTGIPESIPSAIPRNWDTPLSISGIPTIPNSGIVIKSKNNSSHVEPNNPSSLSKSEAEKPDDDGVFLESIREVYERATGNSWTTADAMTAQKGRDIPREVWSIAICYCVDRAPGHTFQRLAYVLEQAREHAEAMKGYSQSDLRAIARHGMRITERARAAGKWTLAEIQSEEGKSQS